MPGEAIPLKVSRFIAAQLGEDPDDLSCYAETDVTRRRHLVDLRQVYGYKMFSGRGARDLKSGLKARQRLLNQTKTLLDDLSRKVDASRLSCQECRSLSACVPTLLSLQNAV